MGVFKRKYKNGGGKLKAFRNYSVEFRDHDGAPRRVTGFSDKAASLEMERQLKKLVALRMAGIGPDAELTHFLASCPASVLEQLAEWGIVAADRAAAGKRFADHIDDWKAAMEAKGNCVRHVRGFTANLRHVATDSKWKQLTDIFAADLVRWIADRKAIGRSAATINHHIRAAKAFLCLGSQGKAYSRQSSGSYLVIE